MKVFTIKEDVFKTEPLFVIGCSYVALCDLLHRRFRVEIDRRPSDEQTLGTMLTLNGPPWRVVWMKRDSLTTAVHEIFHLVTRICHDKGIRIVSQDENGSIGDETAAYLLEFFMKAYLERRH